MGFDVLYFPPIHPIGTTNRKGRNNTLTAGPDDLGSPYAIGVRRAATTRSIRELGTLEDFRRLVARGSASTAWRSRWTSPIQCSPDHPWLQASIRTGSTGGPTARSRYAENPPKKYEDIVNVDFYAQGGDAAACGWRCATSCCSGSSRACALPRRQPAHQAAAVLGVDDRRRARAIIRTSIFLSEAFTRPKMMYRLAKIGFSQSYTYFTWRNTKRELTEYLTELTHDRAPKEFFRPHFFVNTPDINPDFLQTLRPTGLPDPRRAGDDAVRTVGHV